jgi:outer membrane protein OmpA-like peptidoglycan-associated protein
MQRSLAFFSALCAAACSRQMGQGACHEAWSGQCELVSVTKVADKELPIPHVIYESLYRPIHDPHFGFTPAPATRRSMAKSAYEVALVDHLHAQQRIACSLPPGSRPGCAGRDLELTLAEFDSSAPDEAAQAASPSGCAQIESSSEQDRVRLTQQTHSVVPQRIFFAQDSADLPPDAAVAAAEVARLLNDKPTIECLGVVGQIAAGESPGLAERRARAIRDLLTQQGIESARLLTIAVTARVFGAGSKPGEADANDRRVAFSVLLERSAAP